VSCYFSTGSFLTQDLQEILSLSIGYDLDIELSSSVAYAPDILDCVRKAQGQVRFLVHNYFPPPCEPFVLNLAATDPVVHRQSVGLCRQAIDLCAELGVPFYSVHSGFALHLLPRELGDPEAQKRLGRKFQIPRERAYEKFISTVKDIAGYASAKEVGLLIENNVAASENLGQNRQSPLFLADIDEISRFFVDVDEHNVGLLLDTGHAKVTANTLGINPEKYFEELRPFIAALHLSDNDGRRDANQPFDRHVWFAPYLKYMASLPMVVEVYQMPLEKILEQRQVLEQLVV
jgi:sugar phosphate isomerase/epimerase